jgi:hypothetical protein
MKAMGTLTGLLLAVGPLAAQETAQDVVQRGVQAHGGMERLGKVRNDHVKVKGVLYVNGADAPFNGEMVVALPGRFRNVLNVNGGGRDFTIVQVINGERAWVSVDGQPQKIEAIALSEMRMAFHMQEVMRLAPLLSDRRFRLKLQPDEKVGERAAAVVLVSVIGQKDVRLFFDRQSNLLIKTEYAVGDGAGRENRQEVFYGDYRDVGGYIRPIKMAAYRDGKKIMEAELTDIRYLDRVGDELFEGP